MKHLNQVIKTYVPLALRTELNPPQIKGDALVSRRLLHAAIGVGTEVAELAGGMDLVNDFEELGDVSFYLAIATDLLAEKGLKIRINEPVVYHDVSASKDANLKHLVRLSGDLLDYAKRDTFYRKEPDWKAVRRTVQELWQAVFRAALIRQGEIQTVLDANVSKLKARYPEKFTCELAVNRNVRRERKVLEQHIKKSA